MNEIRRAKLEQLAITLGTVTEQLTALLNDEHQDIQDLPDNIENSSFAEGTLKGPMNELTAACGMLVVAGKHIVAAIAKNAQ